MTDYFAGMSGRLEGSQDGRPALVFVHGLTFDSAMWQPGLAELRRIDPGRQTLVLDLPGHGGSPAWPSYDIDSVAAAVHAAATQAGLERPVVVGHSIAAVRAADIPYLFIAGHEVDPGYSAWLNQMLPRASIAVWPGSGHFPHLAHLGRFAQSLAATAKLEDAA